MRSFRLVGALLVLAGSAAAVVHTFVDEGGWGRREKARADLEFLRAENVQREQQAQELRAEVQAMRTRPDVQERIVRRELGYVRDDDVLLELDTRPAPPLGR